MAFITVRPSLGSACGEEKPCPPIVRGDGDDPAAAVRGDPYRTGHRCAAGHRVGFNVFFFGVDFCVVFFVSLQEGQ